MGLYASTNQEEGEYEEDSLLEGTNYIYGRKEVTFGANQAHQGPSMYDSAKKTTIVQVNAGDRAFFNSPMKGVPTYDPTHVQPGLVASALPKSILKDSGRGFFNSPMKGVATLPQPESSRTAFEVDKDVSDGLLDDSIESKPVEEKKKRNTKENKNINLKRKTPESKESVVTNSPAKNSPAGKKRKLTKNSFMSEAKQIEFKIDDDTYYVDPFAASAKDLGWTQTGTHHTQVGERKLNVTWELTMTVEEEI
jgi:hypothetical protein